MSNSDDTSKQVKLVGKNLSISGTNANWKTKVPTGGAIKSTSDSGSALTGKSYKVTTTPDAQSGYVTTVTIEPAP